MATIAEKAREEAERTEREFPDEQPAEPTPAEPSPAEEEQADEEETPAEPEPQSRSRNDPQKKFERAMTAFRAKLCEVFEVDDLTPAPHPGVVGFLLPGFTEPRAHENFKRCETCNGLGKVLTGATTGDESKDWHACPDPRCKGRGFWQKNLEQPQAPQTGPLAVVPQPEPAGEYAEAPAWMGDPNLSSGV